MCPLPATHAWCLGNEAITVSNQRTCFKDKKKKLIHRKHVIGLLAHPKREIKVGYPIAPASFLPVFRCAQASPVDGEFSINLPAPVH